MPKRSCWNCNICNRLVYFPPNTLLLILQWHAGVSKETFNVKSQIAQTTPVLSFAHYFQVPATLACVASVSSRGSSRKLRQEQKKTFFCFRSNFRAITRLETLTTQASASTTKTTNTVACVETPPIPQKKKSERETQLRDHTFLDVNLPIFLYVMLRCARELCY